MRQKITVLGSFVVDLMARTPHLPAAGETVRGSRFKQGAGGKGLRKRVIVGLINVVLVLGLMIGCACLEPVALLWGAGGMCGAMIILALITFIRSIDN